MKKSALCYIKLNIETWGYRVQPKLPEENFKKKMSATSRKSVLLQVGEFDLEPILHSDI